jgi:hypothetical protein
LFKGTHLKSVFTGQDRNDEPVTARAWRTHVELFIQPDRRELALADEHRSRPVAVELFPAFEHGEGIRCSHQSSHRRQPPPGKNQSSAIDSTDTRFHASRLAAGRWHLK